MPRNPGHHTWNDEFQQKVFLTETSDPEKLVPKQNIEEMYITTGWPKLIIKKKTPEELAFQIFKQKPLPPKQT